MKSKSLDSVRPEDIAEVLELGPDECWRMARRLGDYFLPARWRFIKGKVRKTRGPNRETKKRLRRLHRYLGKLLPAHRSVHGGAQKGSKKSCVSGARQHLGRGYVVSRDAADCYPSITESALKKRLKELGFRHDTARLLASLMTIDGTVPLGSPISSDALNMFLLPTDRRLARKAQTRGLPYERTYDDLVMSADTFEDAERAGRWLEDGIEGAGLRVNEKKKDKAGLQPASRPQEVHGIRVNNPHGTKASPDHVQKALAIAEGYVRSAKCVSSDSLPSLARKRNRVAGWINQLDQLHFSPVRHVRRLLGHGDEHVARKLRHLKLTAHQNKWWLRSSKRDEPQRLSDLWRKRSTTTGPPSAST